MKLIPNFQSFLNENINGKIFLKKKRKNLHEIRERLVELSKKLVCLFLNLKNY